MTLPLSRVEELERLVEKMTPGPWASMRDGNQYVDTKYRPTARCVGASKLEGPPQPRNPVREDAFGRDAEDREVIRMLDADADGVAALRNAAPELLATARGAEELAKLLDCGTTDLSECDCHCGRCETIKDRDVELGHVCGVCGFSGRFHTSKPAACETLGGPIGTLSHHGSLICPVCVDGDVVDGWDLVKQLRAALSAFRAGRQTQ